MKAHITTIAAGSKFWTILTNEEINCETCYK